MHSTSMRLPKMAAALLATVGIFALACLFAVSHVHAEAPQLTNPYTGTYGPPDCTWYAWQRLHDMQHIDLQFSANAGDWIDRVQQPVSAWDEDTDSFVVPQVNNTPAVGDILVLPVESRYAHPYHVAYVEEVYADGRFLVSQQSFGDYSPGLNTSPYPYVRHGTWQLADVQQAEQNQARFLHFPTPATDIPAPKDDAILVQADSSVSPEMDQQFTVEITLKNSGQTTWDNAQGYQLACISPDCLGAATINLDAQPVEPDQQHTFVAHLVAPHDLATVDTTWSMQHNGALFGPAIPIQVVVGPSTDDQAELVSQNVPGSVQADQQFSVVFVVRNSGRSTWTAQAGYGLTCISACMGMQSPRLVTEPVNSGSQVTFTIDDIIAPASAGIYIPVWQMTTAKGAFGPQFSSVISVASPWTTWYAVQRPSCDDSTVWAKIDQAANDCTRADGLALSQTSPTMRAEVDLTTPNGQAGYDLTTVRVRTQAAFLDTSDTNLWAALVVQAPQDGTCGGILFAVNTTGQWRLQQRSTNCGASTIASGQTTLDPAGFEMYVMLQHGQLTAGINGQAVAPGIADTVSPSSSVVGLTAMVEGAQISSSAVIYSNFALDQWSSQTGI